MKNVQDSAKVVKINNFYALHVLKITNYSKIKAAVIKIVLYVLIRNAFFATKTIY